MAIVKIEVLVAQLVAIEAVGIEVGIVGTVQL